MVNLIGSYGGTLANLAAIVDLELKKREACTTGAKWVSRSLITCKLLTLNDSIFFFRAVSFRFFLHKIFM